MTIKPEVEKNENIIDKWLFNDKSDVLMFYEECKTVYNSCKELVIKLKKILVQTKENTEEESISLDFKTNIESLSLIVEGIKKISSYKTKNGSKRIVNHKVNLWKARIFVEKLVISKLCHDLIVVVMDSSMTEFGLRLAHLYNELLLLSLTADFSSTNVFGNTCPMLLYPLRKLSITKLLQIVATKRAERCSYNLISALLRNYFEPEDEPHEILNENNSAFDQKNEKILSEVKKNDNLKTLTTPDSPSSNTSVEIYRALTQHLTTKIKEADDVAPESLEFLWKSEEKHVRLLLSFSSKAAPQLLANYVTTTTSESLDDSRVKIMAKRKLIDYYQQVLWGEVGGYLEHILIWWSSDSVGRFPPSVTQDLKDFIIETKDKDVLPPILVPSINSLLDAMCCHLTSTSWDQLFQKALVSADNFKENVFRNYDFEGSVTGQLFVDMLKDLIKLNNSCENPYLGLEELPLVEQIPILHRLDHSVHTVRLWTSSRCRNFAAKWDLDGFYCTCHSDITKFLQVLSTLELTDHKDIPSSTSVQVTVCVKMKTKLVSEIRENISKLKNTATECISILAKDCRTECLAILHLCFPGLSYWKQNGPLPDCASDYVEKYLDKVLRPVFVATHKLSPELQQSASSMILRILCESWMEYVYLHRIKFSEWGAVQLLTDFGAVPTWLMERVHLPKDLLNALVSHEVLRRCEGVGRLLLRRRGESIRMTGPVSNKNSKDEPSADNMPAEMYVPNQEQWLELRAPVKMNICCRL